MGVLGVIALLNVLTSAATAVDECTGISLDRNVATLAVGVSVGITLVIHSQCDAFGQ
jgi:hypothetical protein